MNVHLQDPAVAKRIIETIDWRLLLKCAEEAHTNVGELACLFHLSAEDLLVSSPARTNEHLSQ